jgi:hypothetical protein
MIPLPEAEAAYKRLVSLTALEDDIPLIIEAAGQPGMPAEIVTLGAAVDASEKAWNKFKLDSSDANAIAWTEANETVTKLVTAAG